jgi:hypothetical protein
MSSQALGDSFAVRPKAKMYSELNLQRKSNLKSNVSPIQPFVNVLVFVQFMNVKCGSCNPALVNKS